MLKPFSAFSLQPISEAYFRVINEDAEGKNINRAERYVKTEHPEIIGRRLDNGVEMTPRVFTQEIRKLTPNVRMSNCKFLLGASRIYFEDMADDPEEMQRKASRFNRILKLVASETHVNEYDHDLNGMSLDDLERQFGGAVSNALKNDMSAVAAKERQRNADYEIVKIPNFDAAKEYGVDTSWCVTHSEEMFDNYTGNGIGLFYFCLRDGYKDVPKEKGEGCPLDEYGKSMIAVSVNDDGSLNTCTCRWNHDNGGNDSIMTTEQISDLLGIDFYKTFKPRDVKDIIAKYRKESISDDFAAKMGWVAVIGNSRAVEYVFVSEKDGHRIAKYRKVFRGRTSSCRDAVCVADDCFRWYDVDSGKSIPPPDAVYDSVECQDWDRLTGLEGSPSSVEGNFSVSGCRNLHSLKGMPKQAFMIQFRYCPLKEDSVDDILGNKFALKSIFGRTAEYGGDDGTGLTVRTDMRECVRSLAVKLYKENANPTLQYLLYAYVGGTDMTDIVCRHSEEVRDFVRKVLLHSGWRFDEMMADHGCSLKWSDVVTVLVKGGEKTDTGLDYYVGQYNIYKSPLKFIFQSNFKFGAKPIIEKMLAEEIFPKLHVAYDGLAGDVMVTMPSSAVKRMVRDYVISGCRMSFLSKFSAEWVSIDGIRNVEIPESVYGVLTGSGSAAKNWNVAVEEFAEYMVRELEGDRKYDSTVGSALRQKSK